MTFATNSVWLAAPVFSTVEPEGFLDPVVCLCHGCGVCLIRIGGSPCEVEIG